MPEDNQDEYTPRSDAKEVDAPPAPEPDADSASSSDEEEDYSLDYERTGRSDVKKAYGKLKKYREGDNEAKNDLSDAPRRWKVLSTLRPEIKWTAIETTIPLSLTLYSILVAFFLLMMDPESAAVTYLTAQNRIGDLFVADIALIGFFAVMAFVGPKILERAKLELDPRLRKYALGLLILFQLIPVAIITVFLGATFSGEDVAQRGYEIYLNTIANLKPKVPTNIVDIGEWYYSISPIGVSAKDILAVMFIAGVVYAIPYLIELFKAAAYVVASDPEEFPEIEVDEEDLYEEPDPMEAAQFTRETEETTTIERDIDYESVESLLEIPDEMRVQPYPDYHEVQRYWVRAPYAYVCILKDDSQGDYRYYVVEPDVKEGEEELILQEFNERLSTTLLFKHIDDDYEPEEELQAKVEVIEQEVLRLANEYNIDVNEETFHKLLYYIERDYVYYGKIDPLMRDPNVEDISCDGDKVPIFVFHRHYNDLLSNIKFEKQELRQFIIELAQRSGEHISAAKPLLDASLPDGSRIQMSLGGEITTRGSTFTIRLFQDEPFTPIDLIHYNTFSLEQMAYLWLAIEHDKSLIFSGGTASGKTTSMNAVSLFIPPKAKVITIEDTREITLPHENWIPGVTRDGFGGEGGQGAVTMYNLLKSALRQRPEYMVVGEIRGEEAETLFQAMSTGHTTYSTMHADSVKRAVNRLTNPPINVPRDMVSSLDIICIQNQIRITDPETGDVKNVRRNESVNELVEVSESAVRSNQPFRRDAELDEFRSNLEESHVLSEIRKEQGMTREEVREELQNREAVLKYLMDNDIREVEDVTRTIQAYMLNKKPVLEAIENDSLDPNAFKDITNVEFRLPDEHITGGEGFSALYGEDEEELFDERDKGGIVEDDYEGITEVPEHDNVDDEEDDAGW